MGGRIDLRGLEQGFKEIVHMEHLIQSLMWVFFLDNFYAFFNWSVIALPPGEGNGNTVKYSGLENSMVRGARWAVVHRVSKSQIRLSD